MELKKSPYYDKKFLGTYLYNNIDNNDKLLTVQEYFEINDDKKEYIEKRKGEISEVFHYELIVYSSYYEFNCQYYDSFLYLVFDKPVHITGQFCTGIVAPEIVIKNSENKFLSYCISDKVIIDNNFKEAYYIGDSKINNIYFYNNRIELGSLETDNFFIFDKYLTFSSDSFFLDYHKIKFFGQCDDLKNTIQENKNFKEGIIHIE